MSLKQEPQVEKPSKKVAKVAVGGEEQVNGKVMIDRQDKNVMSAKEYATG